MNPPPAPIPVRPEARRPPERLCPADELLILDDGRVMVHHLSPALAAVLSGLNPADQAMRRRTVDGADARATPRDDGSNSGPG